MSSALAEGNNGYTFLHVTGRDGTLASKPALTSVAAACKSEVAFAKHYSMILP